MSRSLASVSIVILVWQLAADPLGPVADGGDSSGRVFGCIEKIDNDETSSSAFVARGVDVQLR